MSRASDQETTIVIQQDQKDVGKECFNCPDQKRVHSMYLTHFICGDSTRMCHGARRRLCRRRRISVQIFVGGRYLKASSNDDTAQQQHNNCHACSYR
jgi:hypothetical protein